MTLVHCFVGIWVFGEKNKQTVFSQRIIRLVLPVSPSDADAK